MASPTGNVFTLLQSEAGPLYAGDGNTDAVYRLIDLNNNANALDPGEATVWFSAADNAGGLPFLTPNGLGEDSRGGIYIVTADTGGTPTGDFVYRTEDLNNDGDANDAGEASIWLDLQALNSASSAFEISFINDVAFITDTAGGSPRVYRAEDINQDNVIDPQTEVSVFIDDTNPFGVGTFYFGLDVDSTSVYGLDLFSDSVFRLTDLNGSGTIDQASEAAQVWNPSVIPAGFDFGSGAFSLAVGPDSELMLAVNGSSAADDNVFRLVDLNGDGDYLDADETLIYSSRELTGFFPVRPRVAEFSSNVPRVPEPTSTLALLGLVGAGFKSFSRRR
ncbi:MAG: PEP-CTERM sorting domain-containing protein [Cyanobacteria bacterium P01_H01_bin.15]